MDLYAVIEMYDSGLTVSNECFFTLKRGELITFLPRLHEMFIWRKYIAL